MYSNIEHYDDIPVILIAPVRKKTIRNVTEKQRVNPRVISIFNVIYLTYEGTVSSTQSFTVGRIGVET